jgi:Fe2+ transport system protein FeoA
MSSAAQPTANPASAPRPVACHGQPLSTLNPGQNALILSVEGEHDEDAARLKQLGLCAGRRVALVQRGDPMILQVLGSRLGVCGKLARRVIVEPCKFCS